MHQLLLDKEHVKDMVVKHGPQLEQVMDERKKAGKLRDAAVTWLNVFLGIKADARASASHRYPILFSTTSRVAAWLISIGVARCSVDGAPFAGGRSSR